MKNIFLSLFIFFAMSSFVFQTAHAAPAADNVISNALSDVERFEGQASGLSASRNSGAKRILKLVNLSHERLSASKNQTDASWLEVNQRFETLKTKLDAFINQPPAQTPSAAPTTAAVSAPVAQSAPTVGELVSGQRVRVKKLTRDLASSVSSLITQGPSEFQNADKLAARQKGLKQYEEAIARYPQVDDPDVQAARAGYETYRQALSAEFNRSKEQLAKLGNVQQSLATIEANWKQYSVPQTLTIPFSEADAQAWLKASSEARTVAEHNQKQLAIIKPLAYLPNNPGTPQTGAPYDANDVDRLERNAAAMLSSVESGYASMANDLKNRLEQITRDLGSRWQEDPKGDKKWLFIGEGQEEEANKLFSESLAIANSSVYLEKALSRDPAQALEAIEKIEKAKAEFASNRQIALESSKLPEAKSKDKKMLKVAKEILENPEYKFGEHGKIILTTSEIVERERKDSELEIDDVDVRLNGDVKMSGTETTWTYKWKEFKFASPLKEKSSDQWYIYWITAKNFSSGGTNTPINKWVSGKVTKGNPILKKNLK